MALSLAFAMLVAVVQARPAVPANDCRTLLDRDPDAGQLTGHAEVDGRGIGGRDQLIALRRAHGDAPVVIRGGDFSNADLRGARLPNLCFVDATLSGSDWRGVDATGAAFVRVDLAGAKLAGAKLSRVLFWSADLEGVDASRSDLAGGRLGGNAFGSLRRLRFDGADLRGFRFDCGSTEGDRCGPREAVSFRSARLAGAHVAVHFHDADWTGAVIDRTEVAPEHLLELGPARIEGPVLIREGDLLASLAPAEFAELRPHLRPAEHPTPAEEAAIDAAAPRLPPAWSRPGATALFVRPRIEFDRETAGGPLHARLLPVLIAGAWGHVMVRVNQDGSIDARGEAVGANGHSCGLTADGLRLDPATGWFSGPHQPYGEEPPEWRGRPKAVLRFRADRAEVFQHGIPGYGGEGSDPRHSDYVGCGARAGFDEMVLVPSGGPEAARIWAGWGARD